MRKSPVYFQAAEADFLIEGKGKWLYHIPMKFRHKLLSLMMIYITGIVFVTGLTVYGWTKTSEIQNSVALGTALQVKSREVQSLMKGYRIRSVRPQDLRATEVPDLLAPIRGHPAPVAERRIRI